MKDIGFNTRRLAPLSENSQPLIEALFWLGYLLCLLLMSFMTGPYHSSAWLFFTAGFYLFFAAYLIAACLGLRCNWRALAKARPFIICLLLSLGWLFLQIVLPGNERLLVPAESALGTPDWFNPDLRLTIEPEKTRWLLFTNLFVFAWFLMSLLVLDSRRRIKQLLVVLILIGAFHAAVAIMAMYSDVYLVDRDQLDGHFRIARGWFVNRNHFAAFLNLTLVGTFSYLIKSLLSESAEPRLAVLLNQLLSPTLVYLAAALLILTGVMMSQSRGGVASLLAALLVVAWMAGTRITLNWRWMLPLVLLFSLMLVNYGSELLMRFTNEAFSLGERKEQWHITWRAIKQSLLFGYGGGSYETVFQYFREYSQLRQVSFNQSHNVYLHLWLEQGLLGLLLWLTALWLAFRYALREIHNTKSTLVSAVLAAALLVLLAALLQAGVDFNLQIVNIRCLFFVIIALLYSTSSVRQHSGSKFDPLRQSTSIS